MDMYNTFQSRGTYRLMRIDYFVVLLIMVVLFLMHAGEVNWWRFIIAFAWIDVLGTLPAWFVYYARRKGEHRTLPPFFYSLYNFCHSLTTNAVILLIWYWVTGSVEWAMLAAPIHILGDRSLFGNVYKQEGLSFEPVYHPAYARFLQEYDAAGRW